MPKIEYQGKTIIYEHGANLRDTLREYGLSPHNGGANTVNCKGLGSCGTCAVKISGNVPEHTFMEKWRLNFPPHNNEKGLRLACQIEVIDDIKVKKGDGFWGQEL